MLINHQANTPFESISEMMSRMLDPPPRSKLLLHELIQLVPLFGIMKFIRACQKLRKKESLLKMKENKS